VEADLVALPQQTVLMEQLILAAVVAVVDLHSLEMTLLTMEVLVAQELLLLDIQELK
jgi:hypothetical protein